MLRETLLILISTPLYVAVILLEMLLSHFHGLGYYSKKETLHNLLLMLANGVLDLLTRGLTLGFLLYLYQYRFFSPPAGWLYWLYLALAVDFMYYWLHRLDHSCRLFWAVHVTHHSSEEFNFTTGFRSSVFQPLYRFIFYIPLPLLGFDVLDIVFMHSFLQIFGILVHTQLFSSIPVLEWVMVMPTHHRVHHASNVRYLDRNLAQVFIIWDRLFGTFQAERTDDPPVFGLTKPAPKDTAYQVIFHEWEQLRQDMRQAPDWHTRWRYLWQAPGWRHDGTGKTARDLRREQNL